jgi:hypothetical protein
MTRFANPLSGRLHWAGPEWSRHIAGKALAERRAPVLVMPAVELSPVGTP